MLKKILVLALLCSPQFSLASAISLLPVTVSGIITAPFDNGRTLKESFSCSSHFVVWLFLTPLCTVRDIAEVQMFAQDHVFNRAISDSNRIRLTSAIRDIKEQLPNAAQLTDDQVIEALAFAELAQLKN